MNNFFPKNPSGSIWNAFGNPGGGSVVTDRKQQRSNREQQQQQQQQQQQPQLEKVAARA